jgi:hypothetical protein
MGVSVVAAMFAALPTMLVVFTASVLPAGALELAMLFPAEVSVPI